MKKCGLWTCKACGTKFPKPADFHQRICDGCLTATTTCQCSEGCVAVLNKYSKESGRLRKYAIGHSPKERAARSANVRRLWANPDTREQMHAALKRRPKPSLSEEQRQDLSRRRREMNARQWQNDDYRNKISEGAKIWGKRANKVRFSKPEERKKQAALMRRLSLNWWADSSIRQQKTETTRQRALERNLDGENNPNWHGGKSFEPYPATFNEKLKEMIRDRDGRRCFLCGLPEAQHHRKLAIHHIDYIKENCDPVNLVSLCDSCHGKTVHDREYWTNYLASLMRQRTL